MCVRSSHESIVKGTRRLRSAGTSGDHPTYSVIKIGQNTKKNPGDLRILAVTQTPSANSIE